MITKVFQERAQYLSSVNRITFTESKELESIIKENITPKYSLCTKCKAQIRHAQLILRNWLNTQEVIEDVIRSVEPLDEPILVKEANFEIEIDEVEADRAGCMKCKRKSKTEVTTTKTTRKPRTKK